MGGSSIITADSDGHCARGIWNVRSVSQKAGLMNVACGKGQGFLPSTEYLAWKTWGGGAGRGKRMIYSKMAI